MVCQGGSSITYIRSDRKRDGMSRKWLGLAISMSGIIVGVLAVKYGLALSAPLAEKPFPATSVITKPALSSGPLPPVFSVIKPVRKQTDGAQPISFNTHWQFKAEAPDLSAYQISIKKEASKSYVVMPGVTLKDGKVHIALHGSRSVEIDRTSPQIMLKKQF